MDNRDSYTGTTYNKSGAKTGDWVAFAMVGDQIVAVEGSDYTLKKPLVEKMNAAKLAKPR